MFRMAGKKERGSSLLFVILLVMIFTVLLMDFAWITARTAGNVQKNREHLRGLAAAESIHKALCREVSSGKSAVIQALKREAEEEEKRKQENENGKEGGDTGENETEKEGKDQREQNQGENNEGESEKRGNMCQEEGADKEYTALGRADLGEISGEEGEGNPEEWKVEVEISARFCEKKAVVRTKVWYGEQEYTFSSEVTLDR